MALKIIGRVHKIGDMNSIPSKNGGEPFKKREIILDATRFDGLTGERGAENFPAFEFIGDRCSDLDSFKTGDVVEVSFDLQGTFYKDKDNVDKNFTRVRGYKIEPFTAKKRQQPAPQPQVAQPAQPPMPSDYPPPPPASGDLPF